MRFWKYHGLGNDFVVIDGVRDALHASGDWPALAPRLCDRHVGVGADGVLLVTTADASGAHVRMRVFNADGSEPEMCGNGVRCVARFARDRLGVGASPLRVQTGTHDARTVQVHASGESAFTVDMGAARVGAEYAGVDHRHAPRVGGTSARHTLSVDGRAITFVPVGVGNPHAVIVLGVGDAPLNLREHGPLIERHAAFPQRTNVHTVRVHSSAHIQVDTWERGAGLTRACGSGACACAAACAHLALTEPAVRVTLPGGDLRIELDERFHARMTGPAVEVFEGTWPGSAPR